MDQAVEQQPRLVQITPPSFTEAWEMVASQLRMEMSSGHYASWVQPLRPLSFKEGVYRVSVVNSYGRDWVESRLRARITRLLEGIYNQPVTLSLTVRPEGGAEVPEGEVEVVTAADGAPAGQGEEPASPKARVTQAHAPASLIPGGSAAVLETPVGDARSIERKKKPARPDSGEGSPRKIQLQRAYGTERARVVQPERGLFLTMYFFSQWLPLLGHSAMTTVIAARSLCYWNPMTGELRNVVETDMAELARRAAVSVRTVKDVLNNPLVKQYFLRYKVRRVMTPNGVRTAGIVLQVRMDDPLTPEDQEANHLPEEERWYTADFEDETED